MKLLTEEDRIVYALSVRDAKWALAQMRKGLMVRTHSGVHRYSGEEIVSTFRLNPGGWVELWVPGGYWASGHAPEEWVRTRTPNLEWEIAQGV